MWKFKELRSPARGQIGIWPQVHVSPEPIVLTQDFLPYWLLTSYPIDLLPCCHLGLGRSCLWELLCALWDGEQHPCTLDASSTPLSVRDNQKCLWMLPTFPWRGITPSPGWALVNVLSSPAWLRCGRSPLSYITQLLVTPDLVQPKPPRVLSNRKEDEIRF